MPSQSLIHPASPCRESVLFRCALSLNTRTVVEGYVRRLTLSLGVISSDLHVPSVAVDC